MKNLKIPSVISILVLTLITVIMWISLTVYRALATKPEASVPENISAPLTPTLDQDTINKIDSSLFLDDSQIPQGVITQTSTTQPTPTPIVTVASPTPVVEATPATVSASPTP
jgi:hypothetical protein